ncbi:MAG: hypothetical protein WBM07_12300 [Chitinivibrionales bacterium]
MLKRSEASLLEQANSTRSNLETAGHLSVLMKGTSYFFEILNVTHVLTEINISNEKHAAGWVFFKDHDQMLSLFDMRENEQGNYRKPVTIVMAEVLSHGCIVHMGFIVENKGQFIKKLSN